MFDYWAILKTRHGAIHIEIEFKTGQSSKSKEQKIWGDFLKSMNCHHFEIRDNNLDKIIHELKNLVAHHD